MDKSKKNIILIGMPKAGKSILGKRLAEKLKMNFLDTDEHIEAKENKKLYSIIEGEGDANFIKIEKNYILKMNPSNYVISTGGSVVLNKQTMDHLRNLGLIIFLHVPFDILEKRFNDLYHSNIIGLKSCLSFKEIYDLRMPFYLKYSDLAIQMPRETSIESCVDLLESKLREYNIAGDQVAS